VDCGKPVDTKRHEQFSLWLDVLGLQYSKVRNCPLPDGGISLCSNFNTRLDWVIASRSLTLEKILTKIINY
jgi:hypothetical protein